MSCFGGQAVVPGYLSGGLRLATHRHLQQHILHLRALQFEEFLESYRRSEYQKRRRLICLTPTGSRLLSCVRSRKSKCINHIC
jgi:DNA-binding MarR family transcriptional regulator